MLSGFGKGGSEAGDDLDLWSKKLERAGRVERASRAGSGAESRARFAKRGVSWSERSRKRSRKRSRERRKRRDSSAGRAKMMTCFERALFSQNEVGSKVGRRFVIPGKSGARLPLCVHNALVRGKM